jgi:protein-disulfide isomerase
MLERYRGRLNWVIRNFPLSFHDPAAHREAFAAECVAKLAGNDAYWKYTELLFANTGTSGHGLPPEHSVEKLAADFGIQAPALDACMSDPATRMRVDEDIKSGTAAGISGTPTSIVRNNETGATVTITGAQPLDEVVRSIDAVFDARGR